MAENCHNFWDTTLMCLETPSFCYDDLDFMDTYEHSHQSNGDEILTIDNGRAEPLIDFSSEESFGLMLEKESKNLTNNDYLNKLRNDELDLTARTETLDLMRKADSQYNFGELIFCLAINYLDRFISANGLKGRKNWTMQLLAVACLSLAMKMEENNVPMAVVLQEGEPKVFFGDNPIKKMELHILSTLDWRMQSCTPCSFIHYFLRKINGDQFTLELLVPKSMQLILSAMKGINYLEFRPFEVAATVALFVSREMQFIMDLNWAITTCFTQEVLKERVMNCFELIQELAADPPIRPNGVLEAAVFSYKSVKRSIELSPSSSHTNPNIKRRRM